jgi:tetratricopeptide (TPR) repeat protein
MNTSVSNNYSRFFYTIDRMFQIGGSSPDLRIYNLRGGQIWQGLLPQQAAQRAMSAVRLTDFLEAIDPPPDQASIISFTLVPPHAFSEKPPEWRESILNGVGQVIQKYNRSLPIDDETIEADIKCSISQEVLRDPVQLPCGHTFEKDSIQEWYLREQNRNEPLTCPNCRAENPEGRMEPNRRILALINALKAEPKIPLLGQQLDPELAQHLFEQAEKLFEKGEKTEGWAAFKEGLKFTNSIDRYAQLPQILHQIGESEQAVLANLQLAQYKVEVGNLPAAIELLRASELIHRYPEIGTVLAFLYLETNQITTALHYAQQYLGDDVQQRVNFYKQVLRKEPNHLELYSYLIRSPLLGPLEKRHLLLQGASQAIEIGDPERAEAFCRNLRGTSREQLIAIYQKLAALTPSQYAPRLLELQSNHVAEPLIFGREEWKRLVGVDIVGSVPDIPHVDWSALCPLSEYGESIRENQMLVLFPKTVSHKWIFGSTKSQLTIQAFRKLVKTAQKGIALFDKLPKAVKDLDKKAKLPGNYWALVTTHSLSESEGKGFEAQQALVSIRTDGAYRVPMAREVAIASALNLLAGNRETLLPKDPRAAIISADDVPGYPGYRILTARKEEESSRQITMRVGPVRGELDYMQGLALSKRSLSID